MLCRKSIFISDKLKETPLNGVAVIPLGKLDLRSSNGAKEGIILPFPTYAKIVAASERISDDNRYLCRVSV